MHKRKLSLVRAAAVGAAVLSATLIVGAGVASASIPADPPGGAVPVPPHFYNGNVEGIRDSGSDTTFFMMQKIGDLYTGAGLYGCTLNTTAGQTLYNSGESSTTSNEEYYCQSGQNISTTDVNDNWDRVEVTQGVDDVGSGAGQSQLCGATDTPLNVDFSRSSKPAGTACNTMVETGYAKDGVPVLAYPVDPNTYGTSTTAPYSSINGGVVGPVALGWLPGDPTSGPYTGSAFTNLSNADNGGGASSTAYRIWCATNSTRITDWGSLTNLGPNIVIPGASVTSGSPTVTLANPVFSSVATGQTITGSNIPSGTTISSIGGGGTSLTLSNNATGTSSNENPKVNIGTTLAEGNGAPIGVPIRVVGVNTNSGTEATWTSYSASGQTSGGCSANMDTNAASDPNPVTATGTNSGQHIALENNSDQLDQFAQTDFPSPDYVDQAIEVATSLYIESNGVYNTNPYAAASTIDGTSYSGIKLNENGFAPSTANDLTNKYGTARTLFNIYNTTTVRASAGGFINWVCDSNSNFGKGLDNTTGLNFDAELTTTISTVFGFPRLTDETSAPAISTPPDNLAAPNNTCAASLPVNTTSGSDTITLASGTFPVDIVNAGGLVGGGSVGISNADFPAGTTVVSGAGTSTLTLSNNATATGTGVATVFAGVPAVTAVANPQS